ncbi:MAG: WecB/TagA/CpsF family glycosyltransferase [Thermomicrobia bacterium]|nr:WecB/TagA/CpsF family glycosyltransferase [Thermomicrobia bacterium]
MRVAAFIASGQPHHVMTPNPEFVIRARRDPAFRSLLDHVDFAPADGVGLKWAARLLGVRIRTWSGAPDPEQDDALCQRIEAAKPVDVLLVAYGAPRQDEWIARNQPRLRIPVAIGVGGTLDVIAGHSRRPPRLVRRLNLIWLFRLLTEPWRWRRQLSLVHFAVLVVRESLRQQRT